MSVWTMLPTRRALGVCTATVALLIAGCSSGHHSASGPTSTTARSTTAITTTPRSVAGLTAEQLNAHLGVGIPAGWVPVDEGDARVWVPKDWILETNDTCIGGAALVGMISVGRLPNADCERRGDFQLPPVTQSVALIASQHRDVGRPFVKVHGYRIYKVASTNSARALWDVPQLGIRIATSGTPNRRVLQTIGPSARMVALLDSEGAFPSDWKTTTEDGVSLSIPKSWKTVAAVGSGCGSLISDRSHEVLLVSPSIRTGPSCAPPMLPRAADATHEAVDIYLTQHNPYAPRPTKTPIATLHHGTTTITIDAEHYDPNVLDLFVQRAGSTKTHVLTLGLGRDGRIAGAVLASLQATA